MWVVANMDPLGAANELRYIAPGPGQRLGDLHAAGAAADDAPALAIVRHAMVPVRGVKCRAGKAVATRNVRQPRPVQEAGGADEGVGHVVAASGGLDPPPSVGNRAETTSSLKRMNLVQAAVVCDLLDIGVDFLRRRVFARPVVVRLERELVLPRQYVNKQPGKCVVAPGPADLAGFLVDGEIDTGALRASRP